MGHIQTMKYYFSVKWNPVICGNMVATGGYDANKISQAQEANISCSHLYVET
jgi:hypothetical protein